MKIVMFLWLCVNDPYATFENTCIQTTLKEQFETMLECQLAAKDIYRDLEGQGVYMTSFCASKMIQSTEF